MILSSEQKTELVGNKHEGGWGKREGVGGGMKGRSMSGNCCYAAC